MLKFLKRFFSFLLLVPVVLILPILAFDVDGTTDPYYLRLTTPKQTSLILGTSRAAQGLQPQVFKKVLDKDIFNYAFTLGHSPYGPTYLNSIKKKLSKEGSDNIYIVTVDPWSISSSINHTNDESYFKEKDRILGRTPKVNTKPNITYIFNNFQGNLNQIIYNPSSMLLHKNGWLEIGVAMDSTSVAQRLENKTKSYREQVSPNLTFSSLRFDYLKQTITYLNQYGEVYLVRLPIHKQILEIEEDFMPDFNDKIETIIPLSKAYYDMTSEHKQYQYTDGNHIYKDSGIEVSKKIANWIKGIEE